MERDQLADYLAAIARDDCIRIEKTLKTSPFETTELVYFVGENSSELGPFIRKRINSRDLGEAYLKLALAQKQGARFIHLPRIYDVHRTEDSVVVVMEFIEGNTLFAEVSGIGGSAEFATRWFPLICDAVDELHSRFDAPIIHRDLKPSNILVSQNSLTVIDFGIARVYREGAESDTTHFGTRAYAPPEQFGYGQTDERSDVYALGMLLYFLLIGKGPAPNNALALFSDPAISPQLQEVLKHACAFDPADRYQSASELKAAFLEAVRAGEAPPPKETVSLQGSQESQKSQGLQESQGTHETQKSQIFQEFRESQNAQVTGVASLEDRSPNRGVARRFLKACSERTTAETVGLIWDGILTVVWLFFMIVASSIPFSPTDEYSAWPLWLRICLYWSFGLTFFTGFLFILFDIRVFRRAFPKARLLFGQRLRLLGTASIILSILLILVWGLIASALVV